MEGQRSRKRTKQGVYISSITYEKVASMFDRPTEDVCKELGLGITSFKKLCRRFGIIRWPYRTNRGRPHGKQGQPEDEEEEDMDVEEEAGRQPAAEQRPQVVPQEGPAPPQDAPMPKAETQLEVEEAAQPKAEEPEQQEQGSDHSSCHEEVVARLRPSARRREASPAASSHGRRRRRRGASPAVPAPMPAPSPAPAPSPPPAPACLTLGLDQLAAAAAELFEEPAEAEPKSGLPPATADAQQLSPCPSPRPSGSSGASWQSGCGGAAAAAVMGSSVPARAGSRASSPAPGQRPGASSGGSAQENMPTPPAGHLRHQSPMFAAGPGGAAAGPVAAVGWQPPQKAEAVEAEASPAPTMHAPQASYPTPSQVETGMVSLLSSLLAQAQTPAPAPCFQPAAGAKTEYGGAAAAALHAFRAALQQRQAAEPEWSAPGLGAAQPLPPVFRPGLLAHASLAPQHHSRWAQQAALPGELANHAAAASPFHPWQPEAAAPTHGAPAAAAAALQQALLLSQLAPYRPQPQPAAAYANTHQPLAAAQGHHPAAASDWAAAYDPTSLHRHVMAAVAAASQMQAHMRL